MSEIAAIRERLAKIETTQTSHGEVLDRIDGKLDAFGARITAVEVNSAKYGSLAGAIVSVGVAAIMEKLKGGG